MTLTRKDVAAMRNKKVRIRDTGEMIGSVRQEWRAGPWTATPTSVTGDMTRVRKEAAIAALIERWNAEHAPEISPADRRALIDKALNEDPS
jgi:hypothetical protein